MNLSDNFKQDILSKNTKIIPLVVIEKLDLTDSPNEITDEHYKRMYFSTEPVNLNLPESNHFQPLLLDVPRFSQKIDLENGKHQVSKLNIVVSNIKYNNLNRVSDFLQKYNLLNSVLCLYYKSQGCSSLTLPSQDIDGVVQDEIGDVAERCPRVYTGVVRDIKQTSEKITFSVEDISLKKLNQNLPIERLGSDSTVPEKYKNKFYPMLFGKLKNAPTVAKYIGEKLTYKADYIPPYKLVHEDFLENEIGSLECNAGAISLYEQGYHVINQRQRGIFGSPEDYFSEQEEEYFDLYDPENSQYQFFINSGGVNHNSVYFNNKSLFFAKNRLETIYKGPPLAISLRRNAGQGFPSTNFGGEGGGTSEFIPAGLLFSGEHEFMTQNHHESITDGNYATSIELNESTTFGCEFPYNFGGLMAAYVPCFTLSWNFGPMGAKWSRPILTKINNIRLPERGDTLLVGHGTTEAWHQSEPNYFIWHQHATLEDIHWGAPHAHEGQGSMITWHQPNMAGYADLRNLISFEHGQSIDQPEFDDEIQNMHYNEDAVFGLTSELDSTPTLFSEFSSFVDSGFYFDPLHPTAKIPFIKLLQGSQTGTFYGDTDETGVDIGDHNGSWAALQLCLYVAKQQYNETTFGTVNAWGGTYTLNANIKIQDMEIVSISHFEDADKKNFYMNAWGRSSDFLLNYDHVSDTGATLTPHEVLQNPVDIIRHIIQEQFNVSSSAFDEDEFNKAWFHHQTGGKGIKFDFSINEKTNFLDLLQDISKSCSITTRFKNNGKIGFVIKKRFYDHDNDYLNAKQIDLHDIISYNFSLNPIGQQVSKLDVSYAYDYEEGKTSKTTSTWELNDTEREFYGIHESNDNYMNIESKLIQDDSSASNLAWQKFFDRKAPHLQIELKLPLTYLDLEVGDLCRFPKDKLIDDMTAHGIDYTNLVSYGNVLRYPIFEVIAVTKNIDSVTLMLNQLHCLTYVYPFNEGLAGFVITEGDWQNHGEFGELELNDPAWGVQEEQFEFEQEFGGAIEGGVEFSLNPNNNIESFIFSDENLVTIEPSLFYLDEKFDELFSISRFDINNLNDLVPEKNSDGTGYGSILNGSGQNSVGGFVALEIRMIDGNNNNRYILSLRNISGTEFDIGPDDHIPEEITADEDNLKLGWVLYKTQSDDSWEYGWIYNQGDNIISDNLHLPLSYSHITDDLMLLEAMKTYQMVLYPYYTPTQLSGLTLNYASDVTGALTSEIEEGDLNLDGDINILDIVSLINAIMDSNTANESHDINNDGTTNILDIITLVNIIFEQQNG